MTSKSFVLILLLPLGVQGCRRPPERKTATQLSNQATTPEQARLWKEAGDQGLAPGLEKLEQTDQPVQSRSSAEVTGQVIPAQQQGSLIPASVTSAIQIVSTAGLGNEFSGSGTVSDIDASGERLLLDLGNQRTFTVQARAGGRALTFKRGDTVRVDYRVNTERLHRRRILAVRAPGGDGVARITETGSSPITVSVPLFALVATQLTQPSTSVDVRVGDARQTIAPGEIAQIGGITVGLLASSADTGPAARTAEGGTYSIELIAWSSR